MIDKLKYKLNKAIKYPFKWFIVGVFVFFGLFFTNEAILGNTIFSDNFELYNLGDLAPQGNWEAITGNWEVVDDKSFSGSQSAYFNGDDYGCVRKTAISSVLNGEIEYHFFPIASSSNWFSFHIYNNPWSQFTYTNFINGNLYIWDSGESETILIKENVSLNNWHSVKIEWSYAGNGVGKYRAKIDNENWSNYAEKWFPTGTEQFEFDSVKLWSNTEIYVDRIGEILECNDYLSFYICQNAGCCWYYSIWLHEYFCVPCPVGECGSGVFECQNCMTEETCNAEEYCYWFDDFCKYGTGVCGEGLELQFCENLSECENAGGYWYDDFCWLSAPATLSSWEDYYNEFGDYATPSAWISNMASTTGIFLGQIGGFLSVFEGNFDLMEAFEKGKNFGEVIPKARGYLAIFDNFLGDFPVSGFFAFLLIFMLAVGVFRIMRNLFQLLKFW